MEIGVGDTYRGPLNNPRLVPHVWFVVAGPTTEGNIIAVNMTDYENNEGDLTCIIEPGDHPRVRKRSVIRYCDSQQISLQQLERAERLGILSRCEKSSEVLIKRIQQGCLISDDMNPRFAGWVRRFLVE
jgi:hypothetical protein